MPDLTINLTDEEKRQLDLVAAALGKSVDQMVSDELRRRYGVLTRVSDVVLFRPAAEVRCGRD